MLWIIWVAWFFVASMIVITQESWVVAGFLFLLMIALPLFLIMLVMVRRLARREEARAELARLNAEHLAKHSTPTPPKNDI